MGPIYINPESPGYMRKATRSLHASSYEALADAILGQGVRPFGNFVPPPDINHSTGNWYASNFAKQFDLAQILMAHASGSWLLEAGSFIGGSARTFVRAAKLLNLSTPIVCVDTWAGDVPMWLKKGKNLGPQGSSGEPRLWHQFMANLGREGNHHVIPLQAPAMVGLRYLNELANRGRISRPKVIYLDTAHDCAHVPSTIFFSWNAIFARFRIFLLFLF